jgi:hypothetical protein
MLLRLLFKPRSDPRALPPLPLVLLAVPRLPPLLLVAPSAASVPSLRSSPERAMRLCGGVDAAPASPDDPAAAPAPPHSSPPPVAAA